MQDLRDFLPIQFDIKDKLCIIVGGGNVALRKLKTIIKYKPKILIIAKEIKEKEIYSLEKTGDNVKVVIKDVKYKDLKKGYLIIMATNDKELNSKLSSRLIKNGYLVNDATKFGNIDFPAIIYFDDITVSVSSGGKNPGKSKKIKEMIINFLKNKMIPMKNKK